ncbi:MAG: DsbA family protein [Candidatus Nitrosotenuis sp.]|nr:MAG: DsbA family protein [Candidatus Nitrosotenuis sp.]
MVQKFAIEVTKSTLLLGVFFLIFGYFVGNVLPISGDFSSVAVSAKQTGATVPAGDLQQQAPSNVKLEVENDPTIGSKDAKVIFYEFSDFQCPFCRRFFTDSLSQLEKEYIDTGKVLFVYKDFPLTQIHPGALPAAIYSECANKQGKWREFHNAVFNEQNKQGGGTVQFGQAELDQWAKMVGLDATKLASCAQDPSVVAEVQSDQNTGIALGVSGTPSFFIGSTDKGFVNVVGAQPYAVLKQAIDQKIA